MTDLNQEIITFSSNFELTDTDIIQQIGGQSSWEAKFRSIMLLGKQLPTLPIAAQSDENLVQGCESKVWLAHTVHQGKLALAIGSDAKIVKGLATIVLAAVNHKSNKQIQDYDFDAYFDKLNLLDQLGPSRANGINAIINAITQLAKLSTN